MSESVQNRALAWLLALLLGAVCCEAQDLEEERRQGMIRAIEEDVRLTRPYIGKGELDGRVMAAMAKVRRHEFVPDEWRAHAYENRPLPIGRGQTISQPYIVALMTDLLDLDSADKVLEIGTGSGYQAAVLAELVDKVYTIEIVDKLGREARERLRRLGYENVEVRLGDGYAGWPEHAPFDAVIVTAGAPEIPPPLIEQLARGGRLVIPVGRQLEVQQLIVATKTDGGKVETREVLPVAFVPFTRRPR